MEAAGPIRCSWGAACRNRRSWAGCSLGSSLWAVPTYCSYFASKKRVELFRRVSLDTEGPRTLDKTKFTVVAAHALHVIDIHEVVNSRSYQIVLEGISIPDLDSDSSICSWGEGEAVVPERPSSSFTACAGFVLSSSEVDFDIWVLSGDGVTILSKASVSWVRLAEMGLHKIDIYKYISNHNGWSLIFGKG